jgi:hypothetical protein
MQCKVKQVKLNSKFVFFVSLYFCQMALPTGVFFTNSDVVKAATKTCGGGIPGLAFVFSA